ncbi:hypothetical protein CVT25_002471 [Psilocybe cyanescens]|uniref:Elongator complex protein 6 n=1 Tax=Psilocybe cyanescens TaxID=93625 RepID=A0A409VUI8_PSICY|nr:hypothetical protein CVT25_002471 [Psilocybe cyanescens]
MPLFSPFDLPEGILLLITDGLAAPADFVLHRCLATHLKDNKRPKATVLSVSEGIVRWKALASKSNINLQQYLDSGAIEFVDVLANVQPPVFASGNGDDSRSEQGEFLGKNTCNDLKIVLERVRAFLERSVHDQAGETQHAMVILDDITMLEWIGFPLIDVARFMRALRAVCLQANATLLVRHHVVTPDEPDELLRRLLQISTYHLEVRPLASGRSGNVSGEVALHSGFSAPPETIRLVPRNAALQYRLTDVGPDFFAKGTSEVVL